nr:MAG TPA: hypothetical protein [Caudoviricetes sp.]
MQNIYKILIVIGVIGLLSSGFAGNSSGDMAVVSLAVIAVSGFLYWKNSKN